jgi:DNA-binding NarL/FixJ family response regulator
MSGMTVAAFVGRTREMAALADLVASTAEGRGRAVVVRGAPGVGKSALLRELCRSPTGLHGRAGAGAGPPVLRLLASCRPAHRARPYAVLRTMLSGHGRVGPVDTSAVGHPAHVVRALRAVQPLVLVLDDGHWADDETLALLPDLLIDRAGEGLGLVLASRRHPVPVPLEALQARLSQAGLLELLELDPLAEAEAHALAAAVLGRPADPAAQAQVDLAGGNPLQILDLLATMPTRGTVTTGPGARPVRGAGTDPAPADADGPAPPDLASVGPNARDLVGMAALLGPRFSVRDLCVAVGSTMTRLLPDVREALAAGILADAGEDCLAFPRLDLHRALYEELPAAVRGELHRDIADRLQQAGAPPRAVAHHLLSCPSRSADLERLVALAEQVLPGSPETAVALWRRHRTVAGHDDASRSRAEAGLAAAYLAAGELDLAESTARRALVCRSPAGSLAALHLVLTTSMLWQRRWAAARATAESAAFSALLHPWDRAEQTALAANASLFAGDTEAAVEAADRAAAAAKGPGADRVRVRVDLVRGRIAHVRGDLDAARRLLDDAARRTLSDPSRETLDACALPLRGALLAELDRVPDALALLDRGEELARARGAWGAATATLATRAGVLLDRGDLAAATQALEACLVREDSGLGGMDPVLAARRAAVALHVDGPDAAEKWLARLADRADTVAGLPGVGWLFRARAAELFARGKLDEWTAELQRGWSLLARSGPRTEMLLIGPELAEALARVSDSTGVAAVAQELEELADRAPDVTTMRAAALTARGIADESPAMLAEAMRAWQASPRRLQAARVTELVAGRLSRLRRRTQADEMSAEAVRGYVECGAVFDAGRLREQRRSRPRPAVVPAQGRSDGWDALTPTERVVARFVELGESNARIAERLVISRRTVETHVSHILAKLRLRSRAELRVAAAQAGRLPEPARNGAT